MSTIIAAIDFSNVTETLLTMAVEQARAFDDDIVFVHIAEPDPDFVGFDAGPAAVRKDMAEQFHREHAQLQAISAQAEALGCRAKALLLQGSTVDGLVTQGRKRNVRLLIAGSRGHGRVHNALLGSTAHGLIRHADFPVLVVPATR